MAYYATTTANIIGEFIDLNLPEIDNARTREHITNEYNILRGAYDEKMAIFTACLSDFSLDAYWNAKAKAAMVDEPKPQRKARTKKAAEPKAPTPKKASANKVAIDYERVRNSTLYHALLEWRKQTARQRKLPDAYIMSISAVIGISNLQPRTPDAWNR